MAVSVVAACRPQTPAGHRHILWRRLSLTATPVTAAGLAVDYPQAPQDLRRRLVGLGVDDLLGDRDLRLRVFHRLHAGPS